MEGLSVNSKALVQTLSGRLTVNNLRVASSSRSVFKVNTKVLVFRGIKSVKGRSADQYDLTCATTKGPQANNIKSRKFQIFIQRCDSDPSHTKNPNLTKD